MSQEPSFIWRGKHPDAAALRHAAAFEDIGTAARVTVLTGTSLSCSVYMTE